ncbi:MAG: hypothetical protein ACJ0Q2_00830 [Candidatus Azotimanducaceae bacterium]
MEQKTLKILDLLNERRLLLSERYNGEILDRDLVVFQIAIHSKPAVFLQASRKDFLFKSETTSKPDVTLFFDETETFLAILLNGANVNDLFLKGLYRSDGNIILSQLFLYLFQRG